MRPYRDFFASFAIVILAIFGLSLLFDDSRDVKNARKIASTTPRTIEWPTRIAVQDEKINIRTQSILKQMSVKEKVGQLIMADINSITPSDLREYPAIVQSLAEAYVRGAQRFTADGRRIVATAKHFIGDGGTRNGVDQGDTIVSEDELITRHAPGFFSALDAGVLSVMASYSSWNGDKMHANEYLLTDVLKGDLAFDGVVVGDWDAHGQLKGCKATRCAKAINADIDMFMVSNEWEMLYKNTLKDVRRRKISLDRLDDAALRVIKLKLRAGLFDAASPAARAGAGDEAQIANDQLRDLARRAVRQSHVLLKNNNATLPISNDIKKISVIGAGADDISVQTGGWTLTWQGKWVGNAQFAVSESFLQGVRRHAKAREIDVNFSKESIDGDAPDLAIVVLHEEPYAEFEGDRKNLDLPDHNENALIAIQNYHDANIPVVAVLYSGRPMWIETASQSATALVAGWLPGTEGGADADLLFGEGADGEAVNFTGRLSFSWPKDGALPSDENMERLYNVGDGLPYEPLTALARGSRAASN